MTRLIALIVTYNRINKLKIAIKNWLRTDVTKVIVVDNASSDGTKSYLHEISNRDKRIIPLFLKENLGGAGGFYEGIKYVVSNYDFDWIVLQDDDAYPDTSTIRYFLLEKDLTTADAYMSAVFYPSGNISLMNMPGYLPFKNLRQSLKTILFGSAGFHIKEDLYYQKKEVPVDFASFVGLFVKRDVIEVVGLPRKDFFLYGDDLEYTIRITKAGFRINFDPKLRFIHDCETLSYGKHKIYKPLWKAYFTYRNGLILYRNLYSKFFPVIFATKFLLWCKNGLFYSQKKKYFNLLFDSVVDGLRADTSRTREIIEKYSS